MRYTPTRLVLVLMAAALSERAPAQATFTTLGPLPGEFHSAVNGLSFDGSVAVGVGYPAGTAQPFRWSAATGRQPLTLPPGVSTGVAHAVSPDGGTVAGRAGTAVVWVAGVPQVLGTLPGSSSSAAYGVSNTGELVIGRSDFPLPATPQALQWVAGKLLPVPSLPSGAATVANGLSADGTTIVGSGGPGFGDRAYRWTAATGSEDLGLLPGAALCGANAVSANGSVVVGYCVGGPGLTAFRWTPGQGMSALPTLPGAFNWIANAVSANGAVVVGDCAVPAAQEGRAWRWSVERGVEDLTEVVAALGIAPPGTIIAGAHALSADGQTIGGTYYAPNPQAWVGRIPVSCYADCTHDLVLTVADFGCFQTRFAADHPYADCNHDGLLTAADFGCFQTRFVVGCP